MNRRKFLSYVGCGCGGFFYHLVQLAPITERKQLKIVPEASLMLKQLRFMKKLKKKKK